MRCDGCVIVWSNYAKLLGACVIFSSIYRLSQLMTKVPAQPGVQRLTCAPAITMVNVCRRKKVTKLTLTVSLFTWDAHVKVATQEGSVTVTLTPAR